MAFSVKVTDYSDEFVSAKDVAVKLALEECGLVAEGYAKRLCPVDTGNLRNSITHTTDEDAAYIGTNVEYGPYVEMGTSRTRAQPFLQPAVHDHADTYKHIIKKWLKNA